MLICGCIAGKSLRPKADPDLSGVTLQDAQPYVHRYAASAATCSWNLALAATSKLSPALKYVKLPSPGSFTVNTPLTTVITSRWLVPNSYSPGAITPTVAGSFSPWNAMDFTLPSKYSFTLNIGIASICDCWMN